MEIPRSILPSLMMGAVGSVAYNFCYEAAEAVYRPESASAIAHTIEKAMNNQVSGTSFGAPLFLMGGIDAALAWGQFNFQQTNQRHEARLFQTLRLLSPLAIAGLSVAHTIIQMNFDPGYIDNHGADLLATFFALVTAGAVILSNFSLKKPR